VKKTHPSRSVTLSSVLLAQRFSSTLLPPVNVSAGPVSTAENKKQHNPRRHVFTTNENQNPTGEKVRLLLTSRSHVLLFRLAIEFHRKIAQQEDQTIQTDGQ
jgi:hypothetical protein